MAIARARARELTRPGCLLCRRGRPHLRLVLASRRHYHNAATCRRPADALLLRAAVAPSSSAASSQAAVDSGWVFDDSRTDTCVEAAGWRRLVTVYHGPDGFNRPQSQVHDRGSRAPRQRVPPTRRRVRRHARPEQVHMKVSGAARRQKATCWRACWRASARTPSTSTSHRQPDGFDHGGSTRGAEPGDRTPTGGLRIDFPTYDEGTWGLLYVWVCAAERARRSASSSQS